MLHSLWFSYFQLCYTGSRLVTSKDLKDIVTDLGLTAKVKPILISFSGLPDSGKSAAIDCLRRKYVDKSVFQGIRKISHPEAEGITFYEFVAASLSVVKNLIIGEFTTESSFVPAILSAFKKSFLAEGEVLLFDDPSKTMLSKISKFCQPDLDEHLCFIYHCLSKQNFMVTDLQQQSNEERNKAQFLQKSLPEGIAIVNVWDVTISESVRHFLAALQGHLYNHHMWLFLDLERDLDSLHKPPEIKNDSSLFVKWRPRLHYLLRSCMISEDKEKERRRVCTIFAMHKAQSKSELNEKAKILEEKVRPVAKQVGVSSLLSEKIETLNLDVQDDSQRLYQKFQLIISETSFEDIPIAWIFLRSMFYRFDRIFIPREDLKIMAEKCGMDDESLKKFCKFYMSFGSVFDLSLINPTYQYVILKPISFLKNKLDTLLKPDENTLQKYPTIASGIVPEATCLELFDGHFYAYMQALISFDLAVEVTKYNLELPDGQLDDIVSYYIPLTRAKALNTTPDPKSIHVITSINTPHIFKQVAFIKYFLQQLLPQFKLVPSKKFNETIIKDPSTGTTVTLVSHGPAMRLHLSKPDEQLCSCIVQAYEKIAENAKTQNITVEYKFVKICAEKNLKDVQSIPSSQYHILPDDKLCTKCNETSTEEDAKLLEAWNKALTKVSNVKCKFYMSNLILF